MPRNAFIAICTTVLLALTTACSSSPPKPEVDYKMDHDFSSERKIAFYKNSGLVSGDNPFHLSDMERNRVDSALQLALQEKGFTFVENPANADLLMSWNLSTQNKTDIRTYETPAYGGGYYGGYNRYSRYNCWSCYPQTRTEVSVRDYVEGTFIVDMIDPEVKQSVWRGVIQSTLKGDKKQDQEAYNAAARVIFESFPPN